MMISWIKPFFLHHTILCLYCYFNFVSQREDCFGQVWYVIVFPSKWHFIVCISVLNVYGNKIELLQKKIELFFSKFGNCNFNWWWVMEWTSSKWGKFWLWGSIWPWRSQSIFLQNNRDLNQGLLHLLSKFGDLSWNGWWVIARTSSWLTHGRTHRQNDAGNDNIRRPKLASGKK